MAKYTKDETKVEGLKLYKYLTPGDTFGTDSWMNSGELLTDIIRGAARVGEDLELVLLGDFVEFRLCIVGGLTFQVFLIRGR